MNARSDGLPKNLPSKYGYGITWRARSKPWFVRFSHNKKRVTVGSYTTLEEARTAASDFLRNNPR